MGRPVSQEMDQRIVVSYLDVQGMWPRAIHADLLTTLEANAMVPSFVSRHLREARCLRFPADRPPVEIERDAHDANRAVSFAPSQNPLMSMQPLSRLTNVLPPTVYRRVTQSLRSTTHHL
jgi:hypothetical protein